VFLNLPDRNDSHDDVILGYNNLEDYINDSSYFGATIGRYANRIANSEFTLYGIKYKLVNNEGNNQLRGGVEGFNKKVWDVEKIEYKEGEGLCLSYQSRDGEEGYPGNLSCSVIYKLTNNNELKIKYKARTDKPTVINMTNHSYFNLAGEGKGNILNHILMINAKNYTPVDKELIPTGDIISVKETPLDFTKSKVIGFDIDKVSGGYDHNYILNISKEKPSLAAEVYELESGRVMQVFTTKPGIQFYSGNFLNGIRGKSEKIYKKHYGFCLEPQHFPDSPNNSNSINYFKSR
jgi:aldose 1-epimerase